MDYYLLTRNTIAMDDKKLQLMKEERIRRFKKLIGLNEDYSGVPEGAAICDPVAKPMKEDGMAAVASQSQEYPELDKIVDDMGLSIRNTVIKLLNANGLTSPDDPEMPFKAEYVMNGIIKNLSSEDLSYHS